GHIRPGAGLLRGAARRLLGQARPDADEPPGLGRRRPVPLGRFRPRRRAARRRRALEGRARRVRPLPQAGRDGDRAGADVLRGRGLPPAVPREARPLELHAGAASDGLTLRTRRLVTVATATAVATVDLVQKVTSGPSPQHERSAATLLLMALVVL